MRKARWLRAAAPVLVLFAALSVFAQQGEPPIVPPGQLRAAVATQEHYTDGLMLLPDVVGTAVTADIGGRGAIVVYARASDVRGLRADLDGFPVILQVTGDIVALQGRGNSGGGGGGGGGSKPKPPPVDPTARFDRPVPIGVSTGHPAITAGTIGARVVDGSGNLYALSNNHVYADENQANPNDVELQPGPYDGGVINGDVIGNLYAFQTIVFSTSANNIIDAAIASTTSGLVGNATPADGYGTPSSTTTTASVNMPVMKYGRTTGQTKGRVQAINAAINVGYDSGVARFINQIVIGGGGFSAGGDSGSLIVGQKGQDAGRPVGLLFAGGGGVTIANPIDAVLSHFGVTIDGS